MSWRPRLRSEVTLEERGLRDATLGRLLPAGRLTRGLAARLDGARDLPQLRAEVSAETGEPASEVEGALRVGLRLVESSPEAHGPRVARENARVRSWFAQGLGRGRLPPNASLELQGAGF